MFSVSRLATTSIRRLGPLRGGVGSGSGSSSGSAGVVTKTAMRRPTSTAAAASSSSSAPAASPLARIRETLSGMGNKNFAMGLGGGLVLASLHSMTGSANDFYDYRFKSPKNPDDLASFYGGEELMELFCVFPIVGEIMMRMGRFDDTGNVLTQGFPGTMKVSMVFSDDENEETGQTDWFNKRERFQNTLFGYTMWDMVLNFGFRTLEDGTKECYHFGEYFHGNMPVVSQVMLLVFKVHSRWVVWSTEHHINHFAFVGDMDIDEEEEEKYEAMEHDSRANMPFFLLKHYAFGDLMSMLTGKYDKEKSSTLLAAEEDKEEGWEEEEENKLPFQTKAGQIQISEDIAEDKKVMKDILAKHATASPAEISQILVKRSTLARRRTAAIMADGDKTKSFADFIDKDLIDDDDDDDNDANQEGGKDTVKPTENVYAMVKDLAVERHQMRRLTKRQTLQAVRNARARHGMFKRAE